MFTTRTCSSGMDKATTISERKRRPRSSKVLKDGRRIAEMEATCAQGRTTPAVQTLAQTIA